jgi:uncharacterized membrane protein YhaH (DUF805 family)
MNYDALFVDPTGRTSRGDYTGALITLLAAFGFYYFLVLGASGRYGMLIMLYPALVLHARRLRDMGQAVWLLVVPGALLIAAFWLRTANPKSEALFYVGWAAFAVSAGFALWGLLGKERAEAA